MTLRQSRFGIVLMTILVLQSMVVSAGVLQYGSPGLSQEPGRVQTVRIYPAEDSIATAGEELIFEVGAYDEDDILITDDVTDFTWNGAVDGIFSEVVAGSYQVSARYRGVRSEPTTVEVIPADPVTMEIRPYESTISAGSVQEYSVEAEDVYGNGFDVTNETVFHIQEEAGGSWRQNSYSSETAGVWDVTGLLGDLEGTAILTVESPSVDRIEISPESTSVTAGVTVNYSAAAYCVSGELLGDVTYFVDWKIEEEAGGSWHDNIYTSEYKGRWTITGMYGSKSDTAEITVEAGEIYQIKIEPEHATISAGASQTFKAFSYDSHGNRIEEITEDVVWRIEDGAGGTWQNNVYRSFNEGIWVVTGTYGQILSTAQLEVEHSDLDPTQFEIFKISGDGQSATAGTTLEEPLVVELRDPLGKTVGSGWQVWFEITTEGLNGDGELSEDSPVITDDNGRASVNWTLDSARGENTLSTSLEGIYRERVFTATGTQPILHGYISVNMDRATRDDTVVHRIELQNLGDEGAADVTVSVMLDSKLSYVSDDSGLEPYVHGDTYVWELSDVQIGTTIFNVVCRVRTSREEKVITTAMAVEYTDAKGNSMPHVVTDEVEIELYISTWDRLYLPWSGLLALLLVGGIGLYLYRRVDIDDIFLITNTGILLSHVSNREARGMDEDIFSGMFTAIQEFVKDSFKEEENYGIKRLEFGSRKIVVERGRLCYIAVVYRGRFTNTLEREIRSTLKDIEKDHGERIEGWSGKIGDLDMVQVYLEDLL